jgi:hypothetical protein
MNIFFKAGSAPVRRQGIIVSHNLPAGKTKRLPDFTINFFDHSQRLK